MCLTTAARTYDMGLATAAGYNRHEPYAIPVHRQDNITPVHGGTNARLLYLYFADSRGATGALTPETVGKGSALKSLFA